MLNGQNPPVLVSGTSAVDIQTSYGSYRSQRPRREVHDALSTSRAASSDHGDIYGHGQYQRGCYDPREQDEGRSNCRRYSAAELYSPSCKHNGEHRDNETDSPPLYTPSPMGRHHTENGDGRSSGNDNARSRDDYYQGALESGSSAIRQFSHRSESGFGVALDRHFHVLALPQVDYQEGSPFLRAYSDELLLCRVSKHAFLETLDAINAARVPNPENQIFQTGANIAKFFIPGGAALGLMAGQIGVGRATRARQSSLVNEVLLKVNLEIFIPKGLELCICTAKEVDAEIGLSPYDLRRGSALSLSPQDKVAAYDDLVASLTTILPPAEGLGRQDPIANLGGLLNGRRARKKVARAARRDARGMGENRRMNQLESSLQWLMLRRASPAAVKQWQMTLRQANQD